MFCYNCGHELKENAVVCMTCGVAVARTRKTRPKEAKSKLAAGLLGVFLGGLGAHNFYLKYYGKAITQLVLSILGFFFMILFYLYMLAIYSQGHPLLDGLAILFFSLAIGLPLIAGAWGLIEGVMILVGSINKDAKGNPIIDY